MADILSVYHKHMTQRVASDPHWSKNCAAYCLAMLVNDSVLGGLTGVTGRQVRALSNEPIPDPKSPGLKHSQLKAVAAKFRVPFYVKDGESWTMLRKYVGGGASRAVVAVEYDELPAGVRCQGAADFGHEMLLIAFDGDRVRASDPLCSVTKWYQADDIRHAAEHFARNRGGSMGVLFGISRVVPKKA